MATPCLFLLLRGYLCSGFGNVRFKLRQQRCHAGQPLGLGLLHQRSGFAGRDNGFSGKPLVAPDMITMPVAVDDIADRLIKQLQRRCAQVLAGLRRIEGVEDQGEAAHIDDACIAHGSALLGGFKGINALGERMNAEMTGLEHSVTSFLK
ncbi:hypothetical protein D3C73_1197150 [compost metagenome]